MSMFYHRHRRRSAAELLVAGMGVITLGQSMRHIRLPPTTDALASDWQAVGDDLRTALKQGGRVNADRGVGRR